MTKKFVVPALTIASALGSGIFLLIARSNQTCTSGSSGNTATKLILPDGVSLPATKANCDKAVAMAKQNWTQYVTRTNTALDLLSKQLVDFHNYKKANPTGMIQSTRSLEQTIGSKTCSLITSHYAANDGARSKVWLDAVLLPIRNTINEFSSSPVVNLDLTIDYTNE